MSTPGAHLPPLPGEPACVPIRTRGGAYDTVIGRGVLNSLGPLVRSWLRHPAARVFLAFDAALSARLVGGVRDSLASAGFAVSSHPLKGDEAHKTLGVVGGVLELLAEGRQERWEPVVTLGGGVVGDLAGFAAAIYRRGVPLVQCPTTLLAMVDASVGGKTGVNLNLAREQGGPRLLKNMVGAFHHPVGVVADVSALGTLGERDFRCGLGECVKHAMLGADLGDPPLLDWTEAQGERILAREDAALVELIARNVRVKANVVEADEREEAGAGGRALLNLGHTFGHAIETMPGLSPEGEPGRAPLRHGEAVALGLVAACRAAVATGLCDAGLEARVRHLLTRFGLPCKVHGLPEAAAVVAAMSHDKKVSGGRLRLVLPVAAGRCRVVEGTAAAVGIGALRA